MLTHREVLKLKEWAEKTNAKIVFRFKQYPYQLVIEKMIKSQDRDGRTVDWTRAFGTKHPHQAIASLPIEEIVIIYKDTGEEEKISLKQLLAKIS